LTRKGIDVVSTHIKKLYCCQLVIVRGRLEEEDEEEKTRFWASSDLNADLKTLVGYIAIRWQIEVLFADTKEILGLDRYQLMSTKAICRFWSLVMLAYLFFDQERDRLKRELRQHVTIGDAWRQVQRTHWCHFIDWMNQQFKLGRQAADIY
jgi:hypothetical protein